MTPRDSNRPAERDWRPFKYLILGMAVMAVVLSLPARPHTLPHRKHMTLEQRRDFQQRVLWHDRSVERFFRHHPSKARTLAGRRSRGWHRAQARWTERELGETFSALSQLLIPHRAAWLCIHSYEGSWTDPNPPFWGGLQFDWSFMQTYGPELLRAKGTADHWTSEEQMQVAERAYRSGRGFHPWPNTARKCGLL